MINDANLMKNRVKIFRNTISTDRRGKIWTSWEKIKLNLNFNHDKFTISKKNVFRGFHYDNKTWKLVSCVYGKVIFFYFKIENTKKFKIKKLVLSHIKNITVLVPPGYAIGYVCVEAINIFHYKLSYKGKHIATNKQGTIKWNDERISIKEFKQKLILSDRDK